ncbi:SpoIID/LytB domain-containing protein [Deinococcus sp.]|uniref:SpoIID/LytB domain-containing protein n=1 Tax=Deinococcus sp. TaxID=47478 RepID=UPI003CC54717
MRAILTLLAWALLCSASATNIRVLIASGGAVSVRVSAGSSVPQALPSASAPGSVSAPLIEWNVTLQGSHLSLNGQDAGSDLLYLPPVAGSTVQIAGQTYRGGLLLKADRGVVNAVNVVDLEDYLRGVVAAEMPANWPPEALKAQAVIARTYAAARINPASYYDLCATDACQVYGGISRELPAADAAILATRNQVVSYAGAAAKTYFSSDSGGYTASSLETWGMDIPYLRARPDPASAGPNSRWTLSVPLSRVAEVASRYGVALGKLHSLSVTALSPSGRVQSILLVGAGGSQTLSGAEAGGFVRSLGAKSTRVNFGGSDPLLIGGAGQGHGVGLSQYGASELARQGWNDLQIMGFYYAGCSISSILNAGAGGATLAAGGPLSPVVAAPLPVAAELSHAGLLLTDLPAPL